MVCPCGRQVDTKPSLQVIADGLPSIQQTWKWNMAPWKMLFLYEQAAGCTNHVTMMASGRVAPPVPPVHCTPQARNVGAVMEGQWGGGMRRIFFWGGRVLCGYQCLDLGSGPFSVKSDCQLTKCVVTSARRKVI